MFDLRRMTLQDMALCGRELRRSGAGAATMEETAGRVVRFLYENLGDPSTGEAGVVLARLYKIHPFGDLPASLQEFARNVLPEERLERATPCLTLLATVGAEDAWCDRRRSRGHQAIPLPSQEVVTRMPMIARLVEQLGVEFGFMAAPSEGLLLDLHQHTFNVFFVPEAAGSPYIPAQSDFVHPYGVRSVLGFGGLLPTGDLFAVVLFSRLAIELQTAELFKPLALAAKLALLPFAAGRVFAS